jgi:hypothetical protein
VPKTFCTSKGTVSNAAALPSCFLRGTRKRFADEAAGASDAARA